MIFPHPDREEWDADWGLTGGEVDILLGADMIHLFPKLDFTVEKLGLYMSFLTQRYIVMGQLPDNAPEEQLDVIHRFREEHSGAGLRLINLPRLGYTPTQPPRRRASPGTVFGGPSGRRASSSNPAVSGTARSRLHQFLLFPPNRIHHPQMYSTSYHRKEVASIAEATQGH